MTDAAMTSASTYTQVRVHEPLGDRTFGESATIGGEGADIVVPGIGPGPVIQIERRKAIWVANPVGDVRVRFDGRPLTTARDLSRHDVMAIGDAQVIVTDVSRTLLRLEVCHVVGNTTISPASAISAMAYGDGDEELIIQAPRVLSAAEQSDFAAEAEAAARAAVIAARVPAPPRQPRSRRFRALVAAAAAVLLILIAMLTQLNPVALDIEPADAGIHVPGSLVALHVGPRLLLLPGLHVIRAEHEGYVPAQVGVRVGNGVAASARLRLTKLPGTLHVDTGSVAAVVSVDGVESGRAPGSVVMPPGSHTLTLRAPRFVDYIATVEIQGAGAKQNLQAVLQPSWGTLQISAIPAGANVSVDGADNGVAPTVVDAPSGVRQVRISAPNLKTWESSVVLKAGEALNIGPIALGQPDAHLTLTSTPSGAEVLVGGALRGRTPLEVDLPSGIDHELQIDSPGYATWSHPVFAAAGKTITLDARLAFVGARVTIQGEPDGAQLIIDGIDRGRTPQSLDLSATEHRLEVRKDNWVPYTATVTPAKGLDRTLQYRLVPADRSFQPAQTASTLYTQTGYRMRLVPAGAFTMASDSLATGHEPEGLRRITLKRSFYFGVAEITNEQFRRFHPAHSSGPRDQHSSDRDEQAATQVGWNDAAEYCNWLSRQDNLPPAYERKNDGYELRRPVSIGYRLPTESEWDYTVRHAGTDVSGTVPEWTNDYFQSNVRQANVRAAPLTDPLGPGAGTDHVIRGANWRATSSQEHRVEWRDGAQTGSNTIGFRVVRYAE